MDTTSLHSRTAAWQAVLAYRQAYELQNSDEALDGVRSAFERWQEAEDRLNGRMWMLEIDEAVTTAERALTEMLRPSRTSSSLRNKRERWSRARQEVARLEAEHEEVREQARAARADYVRVLDKFQ
jgi:hypothetical protein